MNRNIAKTYYHRLPADMRKVIDINQHAELIWKKLTPVMRNEWICWVTSVKREDTRREHLNRFVEEISKGKRRPCCWPGCPHRNKNTKKWFV